MSSMASFSGFPRSTPGASPRAKITHAVFDFDGTLSWLRHGWPELMTRLFEEHVPIQPAESQYELHELLLDDILSLNGKPSVHQMIRCTERVRERGVPPPDPQTLLREYERRLDAAIVERTAKILSGQARRDDFVVHGARRFLEMLQDRGLTLIILSGTIEKRVKEEAALLDLARYFGNHIYGGTADRATSSKQAVIGRLLREEKITGEHLVAFGDGPVEIRVAKDAGALAVGVASDEETNGSGNLHPHKQRVLSVAGADLLVPDYRNPMELWQLIAGRSSLS
jgi:phosphoglycolate phosphatase-like HAD superfamily hydrolase